MTFSEILNILLGGGLIALVVSVITLKATVRKANAEAERAKAEAEKAKAEAESVRITNTENATRILVENIVKPLKEELNATREDLQATKREMASTKREMARLRKAVEAATSCPHFDNCPVVRKLRVNPESSDTAGADGSDSGEARHGEHGDKADSKGAGTHESGSDNNIRGQPP